MKLKKNLLDRVALLMKDSPPANSPIWIIHPVSFSNSVYIQPCRFSGTSITFKPYIWVWNPTWFRMSLLRLKFYQSLKFSAHIVWPWKVSKITQLVHCRTQDLTGSSIGWLLLDDAWFPLYLFFISPVFPMYFPWIFSVLLLYFLNVTGLVVNMMDGP